MCSMPRDKATLMDVAKAARLVLNFKQGVDKSAFEKDIKTQSAILHQLLVLGEAVKRLSDNFRARHPEIPWRSYAGLRDVLIHHYDEVDLDEVWKAMERDIPSLLAKLDPLLAPSKD